MQVQTILHAASTLLVLGGMGAVRPGPADGKLLITSEMTSKGKKTPQDEPALAEKMFHYDTQPTEWKRCHSSDEYQKIYPI